MIGGTVHAAFQRSAQKHRQRDFLCILPETAQQYGLQAATFTYGQSAAEIAGLTRDYARAGLRHGQRVGLMLENRPAMFFHWLGLNALGGSAGALNFDWRAA